jgi:hypothetical protein
MAKTLAQSHADKALEEAVARSIAAYDVLPPGHQMLYFAVAIEGMRMEMDADGDMLDSVGLLFKDGTCRTIVARGLFGAAHDMVRVLFPETNPEPRDA